MKTIRLTHEQIDLLTRSLELVTLLRLSELENASIDINKVEALIDDIEKQTY